MSVIELLASSPAVSSAPAWCWVWPWQLPERRDLSTARNARSLVARAVQRAQRRSGERHAARRCAGAVQPGGASLGLPGLPGTDQRAAEHSAHLLLVAPGALRHCGQPISVRYPLVEALSGVLCAAVAWKFGFGWPALAALVLTWFLIALTFIDVDHQLLPDNLTLPLLWLGLLVSQWGPQPGATACRWTVALEPHRGDGGLREPVERLSSLPAAHR